MNLKQFLTYALLLTALAANAQTVVDGLTIPASHPMLYFNGPSDTRLTSARNWFCQNHTPCTPVFTPATSPSIDREAMAFYDLLSQTTTYTSQVYDWAIGFTFGYSIKPADTCDDCRFQGERMALIYDWEYNNLTAAQRSALLSRLIQWTSTWDYVTWGGRKVPNFPGSTSLNATASPMGNYFYGYLRNDLEFGITAYNDTSASWQGTHAYSANQFVTDSNSNLEQVIVAGTSGGSAPTWPTGINAFSGRNGFSLTSVDGAGNYTGTITGGASNAFAGYAFTITGFTGSNNLTLAICTASTATSLSFGVTTSGEILTKAGHGIGAPTVTDGGVTWAKMGESPHRLLDVATDASDGRWTNWFVTMTQAASQPGPPGQLLAGGIPTEGDEYGRTNGYYIVIPFTTAKVLGRDMLNEPHGFFKQLAFWNIYNTSPQPITKVAGQGAARGHAYYEGFSFSDSSDFSYGGSAACSTNCTVHSTTYTNSLANGLGNYFGDFMNFAANQFSANHVGRYAKTWLDKTHDPLPYHLQAVDQSGSISGLPFSNLALDNFIAANQYLYLHSSWNSTNVTSCFWQMGQAGWNPSTQNSIVGHRHDDLGNIDCNRYGTTDGYWLTRNTASYAERWIGYRNPSAWVASTSYNLNDWVVPSVINGYSYQQVATPGLCTSGPTPPTWPLTPKRIVLDGTCLWMNTSDVRDNQTVQANSTLAHNAVMVNGQGLAVGVKNNQPSQPAVLQRLESQSGYVYADVDMSQAYRNNCTGPTPPVPCVIDGVTDTYFVNNSVIQEDNIAVAHAEREFLYVRSLDATVILDRIKSNPVVIWGAPADPTTSDCSTTTYNNGSGTCTLPAANVPTAAVFHCEAAWTLEDGSHERCDNGSQTLRISTLLPTTVRQTTIQEWNCASLVYAGLKGCDANKNNSRTDGQNRLELESAVPCQYTYQLNVLQGRNSGDANVTASVVDSNPGCANALVGTLTVTLHPAADSDTTIVFHKGSDSCPTLNTCFAQTINLAGAGVTNLASDVAGVSYTDDGPVWSAAGQGTPLVSISISPVSPTTDTQTPLQFDCQATYTDGSSVDCTNLATWASGTPATATISTTGLVTPVAVGTTTISASYTDGVTKTDNTVLTVGTPSGGGGGGGGANPGSTSISGNTQITGSARVTAQ